MMDDFSPINEAGSWRAAIRVYIVIVLLIIFGLPLLSMYGCASMETKTDVRTVESTVAVAVPCDAPQIDKPVAVWPTEAASPDARVDEAMLAATRELKLREAYEIRLKAALDGCRAQAPK